MARYNTTLATGTTSTTATLSTPNSGLLTKFTGTSYTVTVPDPTMYPGTPQTYFNAASGTITLSSPSGVFSGPGASGTSSLTVASGTSAIVASDGTNYLLVAQNGGPINTSTLTVTGALTANPANANISLAPTGTGIVTINPATTGSIANVTGSFTTLSASSTVGLSPANAAVTISPTGSGNVVIGPATAGTINNMSIGASTRSTGAFTTLAANGAVTLSNGTDASSSTVGGTLTVTGGVAVSGKIFTGGSLNVGSGGATVAGGLTVSSSGLTVSAGGASITGTTTCTGQLQVASGNTIKARYDGSDSYSAGLSWNVLQLGNNGNNEIVAGNTNTGGNFRFWVNATNNATSGSWSSNGTNCLTLASNGNATFSGTITENSSIAYKENVNPIMDALSKILMLNGVTYDRTAGSDNKGEAGLIAEDVYQVLPNLVQLKDGKPDGVCYNRLTAYLIEAVKTLSAEVEKLKK